MTMRIGIIIVVAIVIIVIIILVIMIISIIIIIIVILIITVLGKLGPGAQMSGVRLSGSQRSRAQEPIGLPQALGKMGP